MFQAIGGALSLALTILVLQAFVPEVAAGIVGIILKMITVVNYSLDQVLNSLPR